MSYFILRSLPTGFKFDLKATNGQVIATSEVYETKAACRKGIDSVIKSAAAAKLEDRTEPDCTPCTNPRFELYTDRSGAFRFRLRARNGKIIAISEGYSSKAACKNGIASVRKNAPEAQIADPSLDLFQKEQG